MAVVVAEGEISGGKQPPGSIGGESTAALIRAAREDKKTRALVLRVNSPGGEVYAAEQIRREVELTRKAGIPVVVSMGDVAASGGYWISMNADRIFAEPNTITGSIGIFGMYYSVPDTLAKLGVQSDGVGTGPMAGAFDITRPLDPKVGAVIQAIINKGYRDFVGSVAKARGKSYDADRRDRAGARLDRQAGAGSRAGRSARRPATPRWPTRRSWPSWARTIRCATWRQPMGGFERFLVGLNQSASVRVLQCVGRAPAELGRASCRRWRRNCSCCSTCQGRHAERLRGLPLRAALNAPNRAQARGYGRA